MSKDDIQLIIDLIKVKKELKSSEIATILAIPKRRIFDVLPILEVLGIINRQKRGIVAWVEKDIVDIPVDNNIYDTDKILIKCVGAITSVKNMGMQEIMIEQTTKGFTIEAVV